MRPDTDHPGDDAELDAPKRLVEDLRALYARDVPVPSEVDEHVLGLARRRLARRPRILVLRWAATAAVAASVLLAILLWRPGERTTQTTLPAPVVAAREDLDGNGQVDILDAFALARYVDDLQEPRREWDMNGDGLVDGRDVDVVAMAAVSLERGVLQ